MTQTFWPFPKGSAGSQVLEPQWSLMARNWLATGVLKGFLNELAVTANGTAMQVNIDTGAVNIMGDWFKSDASVAMQIAAADPTNPRIDVVAIRVDWVANTVAFVVIKGTPAQTPVAPPLAQTDILVNPASAKWDLALANVTVPAGATAIQAANVTDKRIFTAGPSSTPTAGATAQYDQTGILIANAFNVLGLTGTTSGGRFVGVTTSGAPTSGTFKAGDFCVSLGGDLWVCTVAGTPGTWIPMLRSDGNNYIQVGNGTNSASTTGTNYAINYPNPFKSGTTPNVLAGVYAVSSNNSTYNYALAQAPNATGFSLLLGSGVAQSLAWTYIAIGQHP